MLQAIGDLCGDAACQVEHENVGVAACRGAVGQLLPIRTPRGMLRVMVVTSKVAAPPSNGICQIWRAPARSETNAAVLPSEVMAAAFRCCRYA